jgi:hypothetical protein
MQALEVLKTGISRLGQKLTRARICFAFGFFCRHISAADSQWFSPDLLVLRARAIPETIPARQRRDFSV